MTTTIHKAWLEIRKGSKKLVVQQCPDPNSIKIGNDGIEATFPAIAVDVQHVCNRSWFEYQERFETQSLFTAKFNSKSTAQLLPKNSRLRSHKFLVAPESPRSKAYVPFGERSETLPVQVVHPHEQPQQKNWIKIDEKGIAQCSPSLIGQTVTVLHWVWFDKIAQFSGKSLDEITFYLLVQDGATMLLMTFQNCKIASQVKGDLRVVTLTPESRHAARING